MMSSTAAVSCHFGAGGTASHWSESDIDNTCHHGMRRDLPTFPCLHLPRCWRYPLVIAQPLTPWHVHPTTAISSRVGFSPDSDPLFSQASFSTIEVAILQPCLLVSHYRDTTRGRRTLVTMEKNPEIQTRSERADQDQKEIFQYDTIELSGAVCKGTPC